MKHKKLIRIMLWLINVSRVLLIIGGAIVLITLLISAIFPSFRPNTSSPGFFLFKPISETMVTGQYISGGIHEKLVASSVIVKFNSIKPETHIIWIWALEVFLTIMIAIYMLKQIARLLNNLLQDKVFTRDNAIILRYAALAIITGWMVTLVFSLILTLCFRNVIIMPGYQLQFYAASDDLFTSSIVSGIILLIIAEVFRIGTEMKEDSDLTI